MTFAGQFRIYWLRPILESVGAWSKNAEQLMMRTAAAESGFQAVRQYGGGPARGFFQMEGWVFDDLLNDRLQNNFIRLNFLKKHMQAGWDTEKNLERNVAVMILSCRYFYGEIPVPLPMYDDADGQWKYYKKYWNTAAGDTTRLEFDERWQQFGDDI